ncbi:vacuolar protein sorting-associated protein 26A-like [Halichondria panicea]|uniref:vacuolar protein sorting-associated protein 26A-like n=1 Tax=Halichondria panicea TaxID=6063 RepID=UPI00312BA687
MWTNLIGTANILAGVHGIAAIVTRRSLPPTSARETRISCACRACFHDDMTSDGHMPDCPLLTQTNNHNIQFPVQTPSIYTENEQVGKYEIMDGAPVRGESIPIRLFLAGYDLTPTMRDINKKFSVRYYFNLVLVDEDERRYFKQQEIVLWRKEKPWKSVTKY